MTLFTDGGVKRRCANCGQLYRPRVPDQKVCGDWCKNERNKRKQRSARHFWANAGSPAVNDADVDLRFGRTFGTICGEIERRIWRIC
jgi:hypothetical protein